MRSFVFFTLFFLAGLAAKAQQDSLAPPAQHERYVVPAKIQPANMPLLDSVALAMARRDKFISDSIATFYLMPDPQRKDQFMEEVLKNKFSDLILNPLKSKHILKIGQPRKLRDGWVAGVIIGLLIYTALLNLFLGNDVRSVLQSFYNRNALSQLDKESGLVNSWAFIGLFLLFSLTLSMVLYQLTLYYNVSYPVSGFQLFLSLSVIIILLFVLKFLLLKLIGFVFDISSQVSEYIAILNLTYFNIAFVLLFVMLCFSLLETRLVPALLTAALVAITVIFAWQYLRNSVGIASNFRFHKFYLFIYLCALEICPVLILIKALSI